MEFVAGYFIGQEVVAVQEADMEPLNVLNSSPYKLDFEALAENEPHQFVISDA